MHFLTVSKVPAGLPNMKLFTISKACSLLHVPFLVSYLCIHIHTLSRAYFVPAYLQGCLSPCSLYILHRPNIHSNLLSPRNFNLHPHIHNMATLNQEQIQVLEQSRQRLAQLNNSLNSLIASLNESFTNDDILPSWSSLQTQASIISNNLVSVSEQLSENSDLLTNLVAYPGPEYPARTEVNANILEQLLRTKLDPRVEDWLASGRESGAEEPTSDDLTDDQLAQLWKWAPLEANLEARRRNWGGNFTLEERENGIENVVTGLERQLEDDEGSVEGSEDEENEEEMDVVGVHRKPGAAGLEFDIATHRPHAVHPFIPLEQVMRHMVTAHKW
ncbi:unnamed protein product [Penicillium salamii]|uniref:Mediator of RNA polymerase II transcription subunit 8 n=1 Tax=Penicillium salamii TaxID=1612424 RepID=A0A9W4NTG8_9EURO|nr:unnamed protein product [Penicillium salamii]